MYHIYMDAGTSNIRAFLLRDGTLADTVSLPVGSKDSAISGSNEVFLSGMNDCYRQLLAQNNLTPEAVGTIWASGMVTNTFGIVEVEHVSTPITAAKLADTVHLHREDRFFGRELRLIRGAKTAQPGQSVNMDNLHTMNNVRGEEIEAVGLAASGDAQSGDFVMISPGSHTHLLRIQNGAVIDILSHFTGELNHAIQQQTILSGELSDVPVEMQEEHVMRGYRYVHDYGVGRALYLIHASHVFGVASNAIRSQILQGIIAGSVIGLLAKKHAADWQSTDTIAILGNKPYVKAYEILCRNLLPGVHTRLLDKPRLRSYALHGFLEILKCYQ